MPAPPMPDDDEVVQPVIDWWGEHIGERLRRPAADIPALAELGVTSEVTGVVAAAEGAWDVVNRVKDFFTHAFGRKREKPAAATAPAGARAGEHAAARAARPRRAEMTEANELERGMVAAAKELRSGPDALPSGQP
jgi:hypothetical protein